jgi:predicted dehydrogenase
MAIAALDTELVSRWGPGSRRFRVGLIGCGRIAQAHAAALAAHPAADLVAVCDPSQAARDALGAKYGVPEAMRFERYEDLFERVSPDAAHVCTWPEAHAEITIAAARRGVHIHCEKPMALDLQECDAMLDATRQAGVVLGINHHRRGDARYLRARELIQEGAIGDLRLLRAEHGGGGRRLMAMSTHLYDLYRYLAGDVAWVSGVVLADGREATPADVYELAHEGLAAGDEVAVQFGFQSGVYGFHDGQGHVDVEVVGTRGRIHFWEGQVPRRPWPFGDVHAIWSHTESDEPRTAGMAWPGAAPWAPLDGLAGDELRRPQHAHARMIDRFYRAVDGEGQPLCRGEDGRASIEMALGLYAAHFSGRRASLPLTPPDHPLAPMRHAGTPIRPYQAPNA